MKIAVIGYSASGKSTLAARLGEMTGCPVLFLDKVQFLPGWQERDRAEARGMVEDFLNENRERGWVIDGNYTNFHQERRMAEADLIFFMDFPRRICLPQALYRNWKYKGRARESIAEGCDEKMDLEFLLWILRDGRSRERRQQFRDLMERYPRKVVVLKRHRDVRHCLELLDRIAAENQNRDRTGKITGNEELR
ncbi:DNA topology modulation protein [Enterocloster asparagiformis]|uniref:DNA topology modulation protein FlaR n=1 Tax=Enterocloster asparagiformis TaxID=333367 RepID=UPI0034BE5E79